MAADDRKQVQSVARALSLLNILADSPNECSLSDVTRSAGLPASTVHRLLKSLLQQGYVAQNAETGRYGLGNHLIVLSRKTLQKRDLPHIVRPWLEELSRQTGETANLTSMFEDSVIQLDHVDSRNMLRVEFNPSERFPLHASASGKVFCAHLPASERERILSTVERRPFTRATLVDRDVFERELTLVRQNGYALDNGEREEGVHCVASPLFDATSSVIAAISVSGPSLRLPPAKLHDLVGLVTRTARTISESLGYQGNQTIQS